MTSHLQPRDVPTLLRSSVPIPIYGTGSVEIVKQPWWRFGGKRFRWHQVYTDCDYHGSSGSAPTEAGCRQQALAADTQHAMHHARIMQRANYPGRIRAD